MNRFVYLLLSVFLFLPACAGSGIGYGVGHTSASFGKDTYSTFGKNFASHGEMKVATKYHHLRLIDTSGVFLSSAVNAVSAGEARSEAVDNAVRGGARAGDTVTYSYEPMEALPGGFRVVFDLRFGFGENSMTYGSSPELTLGSDNASYFGLDVGGDIWGGQMDEIPLGYSIGFSMFSDWFDYEKLGGGRDLSEVGVDVYLSGRVGFQVMNSLVVIGSGHFGFLTPLTYLISGDENSPLFSLWSGVEAQWKPFRHLTISGEVRLGRYLADVRAVQQTMIGLSAIGTF